MTDLYQAILAAGGVREVANALGISRQALAKWLRSGKVPAERVLLLERITGRSRTQLRPDLYPAEDGRGS